MLIKFYRSHRLYLLALILFLATPLQADTDDADSLDFESFHAKDKPQQTVKAQPLFDKRKNKGKKVTSTIYNTQDALAFLQSQVALYKAMDSQCPNGWVKTQESSSTVKRQQNQEQRQLNFSFNCL